MSYADIQSNSSQDESLAAGNNRAISSASSSSTAVVDNNSDYTIGRIAAYLADPIDVNPRYNESPESSTAIHMASARSAIDNFDATMAFGGKESNKD